MATKHYEPKQYHVDQNKSAMEGSVWTVVGPYIPGSMMGTVPKFSRAMTREDADYLAELMERAYAAGSDNAQRSMRNALGMKE